MRRCSMALLVGALCAAPLTATAGPITIISSYVAACTSGSGCSVDTSTSYGARTVSAAGVGTSSTTAINWLDTGSGALFDFDMRHSREGMVSSYAQSFASSVQFTVGPQNTTYAISGTYNASHPGSSGYVFQEAQLANVNGFTPFYEYGYSTATINETLTLGALNDGESNAGFGTLTGTLMAGHTYRFYFNSYIQAYPDPDNGATADGCVTLSIGGATGAGACGLPTAVPDAGSSALLLGPTLAALFALGRRASRAAN